MLFISDRSQCIDLWQRLGEGEREREREREREKGVSLKPVSALR
jgi:hypothetical protein